MTRKGWHYGPCSQGGGRSGGGSAAVVAGILAVTVMTVLAAHRQVAQAARVIGEVLLITGIVLLCAAGLAVLAGAAWAGRMIWLWRAGRRPRVTRADVTMLPGAPPMIAAQRAVLDARHPAIGAPRPVIRLTAVPAREQGSNRNVKPGR